MLLWRRTASMLNYTMHSLRKSRYIMKAGVQYEIQSIGK